MTDFSLIFSSRSKYRVLRVLMRHEAALSLRQIAYLSAESLSAVQRSLGQLVSEKLVLRKKRQSRCYFSPNTMHTSYAVLKTLYELEVSESLKNQEKNLASRISSVLSFSQAAHDLIQGVRL